LGRRSTATIAILGSLGILCAPVNAGTRSYSHIQNTASQVKIQEPGTGVNSRSIVLPFSKSTVIELPENVMDVIVSNPAIVEAVVHTSRRTMLIGKEAGQTNVYFYSHDGRELLNVDIRVERDIGGLEGLIAKNVTKQMGLDLSAIGDLGGSTVSLINSVGPQVSSGLLASGTFNNTSGGDLTSLGGVLSALETVGLVRTLAEPTLTAISGETANFLVGGEIPLFSGTSVDANGQFTRGFEFKPFGVSLGFTPVVLSEGQISLSISTEVSEPTTDNAFISDTGESILGISVRRANTVVEMPAGGSLVIAGLIQENSNSIVDGTPGLKDVPGLGALFRGRDSSVTQTEIVIMVTPYLVESTHPDKLQAPGDGFIPSNDVDSLLLGRLNKVYAANGQPKIQTNSLPGPFGHVVD